MASLSGATPMSDSENPPQSTVDFVAIVRAMRFAMLSIVFVVAYFSIRESLLIPRFDLIYHDMLGGSAIPAKSAFVIETRTGFLILSIAFPLAAIGTLFMRNLPRSFYMLSGILVALTLQAVFLFHALTAPIVEILDKMSGTP